MPVEGVFEAIVAPEELACDDEAGCTEDAEALRFLCLRPQARLRRFVLAPRQQVRGGQAEPVEHTADDAAVGDVAILGEVGVVDGAHECRQPRIAGCHEGDAGSEQAAARELRWPAQGQAIAGAAALQVPPHIAALGRLQVERRIVPALRGEDRAEQEGPPRDGNAVLRGGGFDAHRRRVGVGAGELEPELHHRRYPIGQRLSVREGRTLAAPCRLCHSGGDFVA